MDELQERNLMRKLMRLYRPDAQSYVQCSTVLDLFGLVETYSYGELQDALSAKTYINYDQVLQDMH